MSAASCESGYIYQVYVQWPDVLVSSSNNPLTPATELLASRTIVSFLPLPLSLSLSLFLFVSYTPAIYYIELYIYADPKPQEFTFHRAARAEMIVESENASSQQDRGKKVAFVSSLSNNISSTFSAFVKVRKWRAIAKPDRIIKFVFFFFLVRGKIEFRGESDIYKSVW